MRRLRYPKPADETYRDLVRAAKQIGVIQYGQQGSGAVNLAAGARCERLKRVNAIRSLGLSGRSEFFRWRDMGYLMSRGSHRHHTRAHGKRPTRARPVLGSRAAV